ncbi:hypothetical protein [Paenibacillus sp. ISL-20]|uniref:hypothetical protein n=1 Tax=Paenibacillus sp. ISL-20 TaxID=2819163 RepID=UPI001BEA597A|nr:hypothetical protein [Paenibacillus sp. ISL-20]MBT2762405.1 hypothetical protein [Paenibacillus sp. ISL-20]
MKVIGVLQILLGVAGLIIGSFMVGDIGLAAMIGASSALLSGVGFLLPEKQSVNMSKKLKYSLVALSLIILLLFVVGTVMSDESSQPKSKDVFLASEQFDQLYVNAKPLEGYQVDFYGRVFQSPEKTDKFQSFQVYARNDDNKNTIVRLDDTTLDIQEGDILHIVGEVQELFQGKNAFGATLKIPVIRAKNVEKADYPTAFAPSIKTIEVKQMQNQNGYVMAISKVELAKQETRVHLKISNESADNIDFHTYSSVLIQEGKQYERTSNTYADYPEINSDNIRPGVTAEGIIVFPAINVNGENFKATFEGSSDNWEVRTEPFTFEIPLKYEVASSADDKEVAAETTKPEPVKPSTKKPVASEATSKPQPEPSLLPNSLFGGKIPGVASRIGDSTITLFDLNGEVLQEVDTGTGFAYEFNDVVYYTTSQLNINGNITEGEVTAVRFIDGHTVIGVKIGESTLQDVIDKFGEPDESGFSDLDGNYTISYSFGDYSLEFYGPNQDSPISDALYKKN